MLKNNPILEYQGLNKAIHLKAIGLSVWNIFLISTANYNIVRVVCGWPTRCSPLNRVNQTPELLLWQGEVGDSCEFSKLAEGTILKEPLKYLLTWNHMVPSILYENAGSSWGQLCPAHRPPVHLHWCCSVWYTVVHVCTKSKTWMHYQQTKIQTQTQGTCKAQCTSNSRFETRWDGFTMFLGTLSGEYWMTALVG